MGLGLVTILAIACAVLVSAALALCDLGFAYQLNRLFYSEPRAGTLASAEIANESRLGCGPDLDPSART
jgi:hypothetical protein